MGTSTPEPTAAVSVAGAGTGPVPTTSLAGLGVPASHGAGHTDLITPQGRTSIADSVVRKIAAIAAREVSGVHDLGTGGARAIGSIRERLPGAAPSGGVTQGVTVEVGERQAAVDLDVVVEYGVSIVDLSQAIRRNVVAAVERMTGLQVTEVNILVDDIHIDTDDEEGPSRVQ
ncbi:MAG: Asp23/Gls24 family envelope stress response protein [Frankiaceae bacterium]